MIQEPKTKLASIFVDGQNLFFSVIQKLSLSLCLPVRKNTSDPDGGRKSLVCKELKQPMTPVFYKIVQRSVAQLPRHSKGACVGR